ncbi:hypothetical protein JZU69_06325, partial [bacterium]|nr:hypothetical protein [bacterium]
RSLEHLCEKIGAAISQRIGKSNFPRTGHLIDIQTGRADSVMERTYLCIQTNILTIDVQDFACGDIRPRGLR